MVNIQWYPGHMDKARRDMQEHLKAVDMIVEVRDARIPLASANPILNSMANGKPRLILLTKADLADPSETKRWIDFFEEEDQMAIACDVLKDKSSRKQIVNACLKLGEKKRQRMLAKGIKPRALRAMACGIPNAGKSTFINCVARKNTAKTADKPGVTRTLTWIKADKQLDLLDTPGVLWPKFEDKNVGYLLAVTGAINDQILDSVEIAVYGIDCIMQQYPNLLQQEFETDADNARDMLETIAYKRNLIKEGETPDLLRASSVFLHEFRRGKYGRISLERVNDEEEN